MSEKNTPFSQLIKNTGGEGTFFDVWNDHAFCIIASDFMAELVAGRSAVGMTDSSAMQKAHISGADAAKLLDAISVRKLSNLQAGRVAYTVFATEDGYIREDATIFKLSDGSFRLFSAGSLIGWLEQHKGDFDVTITDISYNYALLSVYGPKCVSILQSSGVEGLESLKAFNYLETDIQGTNVIVSRTGFTGGLGYELIIPWEEGEKVGNALLGSPNASDATFIGIAAFNSYRIEAGYIIPGTDFAVPGHGEGELRTPYDMGLDWLVNLERDDDFVGKTALAKIKQAGSTYDYFSVEINEELEVESVDGAKLYNTHGDEIGVIFASGFSMELGKFIGLCNVRKGLVADGTEVKAGDDKWNAVIKNTPLWSTEARTQTPPSA